MCTAVSWRSGDHYFGRNLDLDHHYFEEVTITPQKFPLLFRNMPKLETHYAMIGIASVIDGYPLYYDATNEWGLSMAGLNFPGNAIYSSIVPEKENIAPFEFIPWILCQCRSIPEAKDILSKINLVNIPFSSQYPITPLHWMISDKNASLVVESTETGLHIYDNPTNTLTNNPPFEYHLQNLTNYMQVTAEQPVNRLSKALELSPYSLGMGGIGLPGDLSSASRFVRAVFTLKNAETYESESDRVGQFFHILEAVAQTEGCIKTPIGLEKTIYTSCCNTTKGIYYYTTYTNRQITAVKLNSPHKDVCRLLRFPLRIHQEIQFEDSAV